MKVFKKNDKFFMEDNGNTVELKPDKWYYLHLPTNSVARECVSCKKVDKAPNQCVDYGNEVKTHRVLGPQNRGPVKLLEDYLEGKDRETYLALVEKAKKAKEEATKKQPMTELEKAQRAYERAKARVEALSK